MSGDFSATPAISEGQLFIRSSKYLYCVANSDQRQRTVTEVTASFALEACHLRSLADFKRHNDLTEAPIPETQKI